MPTPRSPRVRARWYAAGSIAAAVTVGGVIGAPSTGATPAAAPAVGGNGTTVSSPRREIAPTKRTTQRTTKRRPAPAAAVERAPIAKPTPKPEPKPKVEAKPEPTIAPEPSVAPEPTVVAEPEPAPAAEVPQTEPAPIAGPVERPVVRRKAAPAPRRLKPGERGKLLPRTPEAAPVELLDPRAEKRAEQRAERQQAVATWKRNLDRPASAAFGRVVREWAGDGSVCPDEAAATVADQIAAIFRCRLEEAGYPEYRIRRIVAEAVTVAQCESGFLPHAVVFGGRYVHARHPSTGYFYTAAGVFQFIRATADQWIEGGYANVLDSAKNIDAAARLFIANQAAGARGWADWACASANDGFKATSVLPGYPGGPPQLPDWAWTY